MSKNKFRPNYAVLYPGVEISPEILDFLKKSDMRMEYEESHRKRERVVKDADGNIIAILPSREDSLERLLDYDKQFSDDTPSPEQLVEAHEDWEELYNCLDLLDVDERSLIDALFFEGLAEREYAQKSGLSKSTVNRHRQKVLDKLKSILNKTAF